MGLPKAEGGREGGPSLRRPAFPIAAALVASAARSPPLLLVALPDPRRAAERRPVVQDAVLPLLGVEDLGAGDAALLLAHVRWGQLDIRVKELREGRTE
jgi:hypothetical protein